MYTIKTNKITGKSQNEINLSGYTMPNKHNFSIAGEEISHIEIINKKLASPIVKRVVLKKFNKLINELTDLLISDDESGDSNRHALDKIEKFRVMVKNQYREYLGKKELEMMSKKLKLLQKEAFKKLLISNEINVIGKNNYRGK